MNIKKSQFAIIILGIGIFSTIFAFDNLFTIQSATAQGGGYGRDDGSGMI